MPIPVSVPSDVAVTWRPLTPTDRLYGNFLKAFDHFNVELFGGTVPQPLIILQRKSKARGYAAQDRFEVRDGDEVRHELAMNPSYFRGRSIPDLLSTFVHEMAHLWQFQNGNPGRGRYHNAEWAAEMDRIGLAPSSTGEPGGKRTGDRVSHYVVVGGPFDRACAAFLADNPGIDFVERWSDPKWDFKRKAKFTCPTCRQGAWGKPDLNIICGACGEAMASASAPRS